jgi:squalene synthase HpnC
LIFRNIWVSCAIIKERSTNIIRGELDARKLAHKHYENFKIATFLIPGRLRQDLFNIYAFLRLADDLADACEDDLEADRVLQKWLEELETSREVEHPVVDALCATIARHRLSLEPFQKLIAAFRLDLVRKRWESWADLMYYTEHSADPVGRIVLELFGYRNTDYFALSDKICTALQLANHWQDVRDDWERGRVYIPQEDLRRFGVSEVEIENRSATNRFRELMTFEVERARSLFLEGFSLLGKVNATLRLQLALYWHGGMKALETIKRIDYDVLNRSAKLRPADKILVGARSFWSWVWIPR